MHVVEYVLSFIRSVVFPIIDKMKLNSITAVFHFQRFGSVLKFMSITNYKSNAKSSRLVSGRLYFLVQNCIYFLSSLQCTFSNVSLTNEIHYSNVTLRLKTSLQIVPQLSTVKNIFRFGYRSINFGVAGTTSRYWIYLYLWYFE